MSDLSAGDLPGGSIAILRSDDILRLVVVGDHEYQEFPIRRAGKKTALRFAYGRPGRRGTIWRLWSNRDAADVYVASRATAGEMKVSLHESGDWRLQIVDPIRPKTVHFADHDPQDGRILGQWSRPAPNEAGWTKALTIALPGTEVTRVPADGVSFDDVRWCKAPGKREQGEFVVWLVRPDRGAHNLRVLLTEGVHIDVVDSLELADGQAVVVLGLVGPRRTGDLRAIERVRDNSTPPPTDWDRSPELGPRSLIHGSDPDGCPMLYDLGIRRPLRDRFRRSRRQ